MGLLSKVFSNTRKPEGWLGRMMVNGMNGLSGQNEKWEKLIEGMHTYTPVELKAHLDAAGFKDITVFRNEAKHWLAVTAVK